MRSYINFCQELSKALWSINTTFNLGSPINHVVKFLDIFDPLFPWWPFLLLNKAHVIIWSIPPQLTTWFMDIGAPWKDQSCPWLWNGMRCEKGEHYHFFPKRESKYILHLKLNFLDFKSVLRCIWVSRNLYSIQRVTYWLT